MSYIAHSQRYEMMQYRTCGQSGLHLPVLSLGLWHNFGNATPYAVQREMVCTAFDLGITHSTLRTITARLRAVQRSISAA